ncbi:hypothetical protein AAH158_11380 [Parabacteroides merdae]
MRHRIDGGHAVTSGSGDKPGLLFVPFTGKHFVTGRDLPRYTVTGYVDDDAARTVCDC